MSEASALKRMSKRLEQVSLRGRLCAATFVDQRLLEKRCYLDPECGALVFEIVIALAVDASMAEAVVALVADASGSGLHAVDLNGQFAPDSGQHEEGWKAGGNYVSAVPPEASATLSGLEYPVLALGIEIHITKIKLHCWAVVSGIGADSSFVEAA